MLVLATAASSNPMGAQRYEREVVAGAAATLPDAEVRHLEFRSMRSHLPGNRRLPMGWMGKASVPTRGLAGRFTYPGGAVVHRMALELPPGPGRNVVTIHDTVAWRFPDESAPVRAAAQEARRADAIICVSHFSAGEVKGMLGVERDPVVIYNGVDERFFTASQLRPEQRSGLGLVGPYLLHSGGAAQRKNLEALAEAWPALRRELPDLTLALCGPEHPRRTRLFAGLEGVRLLGRQPEDLVPKLVAGAAAVVVPSTYEGFGLPALEAMAAGVPVVAARASALPEVVGDAGILVEPTAAGLAAGVLDALRLGSGGSAMIDKARDRAREFTWERCVAEHAAVWRRLGAAA